ncbi:hypothetical protein C7271_21120 [filamentous cyanobacterium CCP5]|nr:hypothetical protein C7271_21120 [filamentous cyanobacterium CCP5]
METILRDRAIIPTGSHPTSSVAQNEAATALLGAQTEAMGLGATGRWLLNRGRYQAALIQIERALALDPHNGESWYCRGEVLACLNRYEEALDSLEQAQVFMGFSEPSIWLEKASILILLNCLTEALGCCDYVLWRDPHSPQAWLFRGVALHRLGRWWQAYRSYQRAFYRAEPPLREGFWRFCRDLSTTCQAS